MNPPRIAMSEPGRIWRCRSATAEVRVKRGSTVTSLAPRVSRASIAHLKPHGWFSAGFATHDQHDVCVLDVLPVVGHRPATERGGQTGHRGAVSYAGLMVDVAEAHGAHRLRDQIGVFVGDGGAPDPDDPIAAIDDTTLIVALGKGGIARLFEPARKLVHG